MGMISVCGSNDDWYDDTYATNSIHVVSHVAPGDLRGIIERLAALERKLDMVLSRLPEIENPPEDTNRVENQREDEKQAIMDSFPKWAGGKL